MTKFAIVLLLSILNLMSSTGFGQKNTEIDSLETVITTLKDDTSKVKTLNMLSKRLMNLSQYDKALKYANDAQIIATEINYYPGLSRAYEIIGSIQKWKGSYMDAKDSFLSSLAILKKVNDKKLIAYTYLNLGATEYEMSNYSEAIGLCNKAKQLSEEANNQILLSSIFGTLANIYFELGNYSESIKNHLSSLRIKEQQNNKVGMAGSLNNIGIVYKQIGQYDDALKNYFASLQISQELGLQSVIATAYDNIGNVYQRLEKFDDALKCHSRSLSIRDSLKEKRVSESLNNLGLALRKRGVQRLLKGDSLNATTDFNEALKNHSRALEIHQQNNNKNSMIVSLTNIGEDHTMLGHYESARDFLNRALIYSDTLGNLNEVKNIYDAFLILDTVQANSSVLNHADKLKFWKEAFYNLKQSFAIKDSILNSKTNREIAQLKIQYETEKKDNEIALLSKENELKTFQAMQHIESLRASKLETEKKQNEITLLQQNEILQSLELKKKEDELEKSKLTTQVKGNEMKLLTQQNEIQQSEARQQRFMRNVTIGTFVVLALIAGLFFNRFKLKKKIESQQAILTERKRISADLHDELGSEFSKIALLSQVLKQGSTKAEKSDELEKISVSANDALQKMGEMVWSLSPKNDFLDNLVSYLRKYAAEYFEQTNLACKFKYEKVPHLPITGEQRRNIFLAFKEALHNVTKHASATEVEIMFAIYDGHFHFTVHDNGKGIDLTRQSAFGNGLHNMRERMQKAGGAFEIENGSGTRVNLSIPVA